MTLLNPAGQPAETKTEDARKEKETETKPDQLEKPLLGIDNNGNMTLFVPLAKTNEVFSRGMVDMARSEMLRWYASFNQKQREIAILAQKTGFQRLKDKLLRK